MDELSVEYVPVADIKPYPRNAKKHPGEQIEHIANSIREFGFRQPLVLDKDNVVVIGHGRLLAAKKLGIEKVPCTRVDDLTEEQIKALRLADNKTNESEWDFDLLDGELNDIFDIDMSGFGFDLEDNELPPIPENLDAETDYNQEESLRVNLTFPDYTSYQTHEEEIKEMAERVGARFSIGKA